MAPDCSLLPPSMQPAALSCDQREGDSAVVNETRGGALRCSPKTCTWLGVLSFPGMMMPVACHLTHHRATADMCCAASMLEV